jgi:catechol 2,3-dioxygenase-like lactoylglutathione lyase family enzyme
MGSAGVTGLDHASVIVTDPVRARAFYSGLLGLREIPMPKTFDFEVIWYDFGLQTVHLLVKDQPDTRSPRHFALKVADAKASREYFRAHKIPIQETTPIPGADRFFINDPDGNRIELIEWQRPYDPVADGMPPKT